MTVVSNTSPLNYLVLVDAIHVLVPLYGGVHVPPVVLEELSHPGSPSVVRKWASAPPHWLVVQAPKRVDASIELHAGEAHAIALGVELRAEVMLIDERRGREAARARGLTPVGVLGVLYQGAESGLVDLPTVVGRLISETTFHWDKRLVDDLLRRDAMRRQGPAPGR
jgi:predicted nucleic acid-binding protein